jgi:hypothetical protein
LSPWSFKGGALPSLPSLPEPSSPRVPVAPDAVVPSSVFGGGAGSVVPDGAGSVLTGGGVSADEGPPSRPFGVPPPADDGVVAPPSPRPLLGGGAPVPPLKAGVGPVPPPPSTPPFAAEGAVPPCPGESMFGAPFGRSPTFDGLAIWPGLMSFSAEADPPGLFAGPGTSGHIHEPDDRLSLLVSYSCLSGPLSLPSSG